MILFVSGTPQNHLDRMTARGVGHLAGAMTSPTARNHPRKAVALGMPWCMDNDCFKRYDPRAIVRMLDHYRDVPGCVFATVPDVVGDHAATRLLFSAWLGTYQRYGYPPAFVLQNGITGPADVPWDSIAAVFVGGDDQFKHSATACRIVDEANARGKWTHMGRVNTRIRITFANSNRYRSIDGTRFNRFNDGYQFVQSLVHRQYRLFEAEAA